MEIWHVGKEIPPHILEIQEGVIAHLLVLGSWHAYSG